MLGEAVGDLDRERDCDPLVLCVPDCVGVGGSVADPEPVALVLRVPVSEALALEDSVAVSDGVRVVLGEDEGLGVPEALGVSLDVGVRD